MLHRERRRGGGDFGRNASSISPSATSVRASSLDDLLLIPNTQVASLFD